MDGSSLRVRYHIGSAVVVVLVIAAFQYWQSAVDWRFLVSVGVTYFALSVAIDLVRNQYASS